MLKPTKVKDLFKSEKNWTQNVCARDEFGNECYSFSEKAVSFCLLGAVRRIYGEVSPSHIRDLLTDEFGSYGALLTFNDHCNDFGKIKELVERLDI